MDLLVWSYELGYRVDRQVIVLRDGAVPHLLSIDLLLGSADELLQKIYGHLLWKK